MKITSLKYFRFTALLMLLGLASCNIKEDMSNCSGTFLLDYTAYPQEILDEIDPNSIVSIYMFDQEDICSEILCYTYAQLQEDNFEFEVPIQYRGLNVLVWQGNDSADYDDGTMRLGESLDEFYLRLIENTATGLGHTPAPLWASMLEKVDFCASITRHRIFMTRIHTQINVALSKLEPDGTSNQVDMSNYEINIEAEANVYHRDYSVSDKSTELIYDNSEEIATQRNLKYGHAGTLRLTTDRPSELYIVDKETQERISIGGSTEINLVDYMLQSRGALSTDQDVDAQKFLDINKVWDIELLISPSCVAVSLTINGWTVWYDNTDLD